MYLSTILSDHAQPQETPSPPIYWSENLTYSSSEAPPLPRASVRVSTIFESAFFFFFSFFQHVLGYVPKFPQKKMGFLLYFVSSPPSPPLTLTWLGTDRVAKSLCRVRTEKKPPSKSKKTKPLIYARTKCAWWWWMMMNDGDKHDESRNFPCLAWWPSHLMEFHSLIPATSFGSAIITNFFILHTYTHTQTLFSAPPCFFFLGRESLRIYEKRRRLHFIFVRVKKWSTWAGQGTLLSPCMTLNRLLQIGLLGLSWSFPTGISKSYDNKIQWRWRGCKNLRRRHQDLASCLRGRTGAYDMYQQTNKQPPWNQLTGKISCSPPPPQLYRLLSSFRSWLLLSRIFVSEKLWWGM